MTENTPARRSAPIAERSARGSETGNISADKALALFLTDLADADRSERTARAYLGHVQRFGEWLHETVDCGLPEATSYDLRAYRKHLEASQRPNSVNAALVALRRFYGWLQRAGYVQASPAARVSAIKTQALAPQGFSRLERHRLLREGERDGAMARAILAALDATGIRVSELAGLHWEHVDLGHGWAKIMGKGHKERMVPLNADAREALAAICPDEATGPVFRSQRGPYTDRGIRHLLAKLGRRAGVEQAHPHRFRHTVGARMVHDRGEPLPTVAAMLGHERLETTRRYTLPSPETLKAAAERLAGG